MFRKGFVLSTLAHIEAAVFNKQSVSVWMSGRIVDYGGVIEDYNGKSVKINGEWHPIVIHDGDLAIRPVELRIR